MWKTQVHPDDRSVTAMNRVETERTLIGRFLDNDRQALEEILTWIDNVLNLRSWHWSIRAVRDDVRQDVLLALTGNFQAGKYRGDGLKSYVSSVTKFTCLKAYDRCVPAPVTEGELVDPETLPLERLENKEQLAVVRKAFGKLESRCRRVLTLRFFRDLEHQEIARQLSVPVGTSRQWLKRCLERLRKLAYDSESL